MRGLTLNLALCAAIAAAMLISLMAGKVWIPLEDWATAARR